MVTATVRRPGRALARVSLRIYPLFRRLTKVQAAILLALLLSEGVAFGALVSASAGERGAAIRPSAVIVAGVPVGGAAVPVGTAAPGVLLFTPSYSIREAGQPAAADQALLVEETVATGEAAR
jgi:hypothetical protein